MTALQWEKLSPTEFQQLQDFAQFSTKKLKDVLKELNSTGGSRFNQDGEIDFESFKLFVNTYLEVEAPEDHEEFCRHLFLSFVKKGTQKPPPSPISSSNSIPADGGKTIKEMAVISTTAVAPIAPSGATACSGSKSSGSLSSILAHSTTQDHSVPPHTEKHHGIAEKLHGLTEKLQNLGHHRTDSESSVRPRTDAKGAALPPPPPIDINSVRVPLKDIVCYLSLLEGGTPSDKLEFMFRLYDTDGNGVLDTYELDCIVNQMMKVAEYLGWDVSELRPILQDMMIEIDFDADGTVSLEEWKRGGLTTIPLLVLLGLDQDQMKEDGKHLWRLKHFSRPAFCNLCLNMLVGLGKKGLCCTLCKYTVHERCVQRASEQAQSTCITTYVKSKKIPQVLTHHWVEGNCQGKCFKCKKKIKSFNGITGKHCRWCQISLHSKCASFVKPECNLGEFRTHILPPTSICPIVLDRQRSISNRSTRSETGNDQNADNSSLGVQNTGGPTSFQITPPDDSRPLLIFINPKSGGLQGTKLLKKFQYFLNPRQVYNLAGTNPVQVLQMFKDVSNMRVICCGGDGTVGWILDSMDKVQFITQPGVGVIPLGTGNDLARCLRWGSGYEGEEIGKVLKKIDKSTVIMMDRWQINVTDVKEDGEPGDPMPYNIINNYFSVGVDAAICVRFHLERERNPHKFKSQMRNKIWYFELGMSEQFASSCKNLHQEIEVECDGVSLDLSSGPALQGLALLNIPYTHGGTNLWGDQLSRRRASRNSKAAKKKSSDKEPPSTSSATDLSTAIQDIGDNLIEVIGLENCLHMGQVRTGLRASGRRLAQCSNINIRTKKRLPMQIDGEPWMQNSCSIKVTHKNQVPMLLAPSPESKGFFKFLRPNT